MQVPAVPTFNLSPQPFLALSTGVDGNLESQPYRFELYRILMLWYGIGSTPQRRQEILETNPNVLLGPYVSAITSQDPLHPSEYPFDTDLYNPDGSLSCLSSGTYQSDSDNFEGHRRWPFYALSSFNGSNAILPQTTYLCRPIIDIRRADVIGFVSSSLLQLITSLGGYLNAVSFDNVGGLVRDRYDHWAGKGQPLSPFQYDDPTALFVNYLRQVRYALAAQDKSLILNTGYPNPLFAEFIQFSEEGVHRSMSADSTRALIAAVKSVTDLGGIVTQRYHRLAGNGPISGDWKNFNYFAAAVMLVYEPRQVAMEPLPQAGDGYYPEYYRLPTLLQAPQGAYREMMTDVLVRDFTNGIVLLNLSNHRRAITDSTYTANGLARVGSPHSIGPREALIMLERSAPIQAIAPRAPQIFQNLPEAEVLPGDTNCDGAVDIADRESFDAAVHSPAEYVVNYPDCVRSIAADMNGDGRIDDADYQLFARSVGIPLPGQACTQRGDTNGDGLVNNFDTDSFQLLIVDRAAYEAAYPCSPLVVGDMNGDGLVNVFDIDPFVELLIRR